MKRLIAIATMFGLTLFLAAGQAAANIDYKFSDVTFSDGGTLNGTFATNDASTSLLLKYDITTSPGDDIGFHYNPLTIGSYPTSLPANLVFHDPADKTKTLQVTFNGGLSATGSPILIGNLDSFEQDGLSRRVIVSGHVAPVPEPETYAMLLAGLGLLGWRLRRV